MVLADFGADVLTIEPPNGSRLREAPAFAMWSRGTNSRRLDLTTTAGQERLHEVVADADVMITALEPATADRLGVDGASMCAANARLVHCEVTGFGRDHPLSDVPGYDRLVQSAAGRAHEFAVLYGGERPAFPMVPVATHGATMVALQGIFAALLEREHTGRGQRLETSLLRALSVFDLTRWAPGADRALRVADVPMLIYTVARTRDGVWLQFSQNSPRLFRAFLGALELEHVVEQEPFRTAPHIPNPADARALRAILIDRVRERSWDEWRPVFDADPDISAEPFTWPGDALLHPQLLHTGDSVEVDDPTLGRTRQLGPLFTRSASPATATERAAAPPARGALLQGVTVLELANWIATPMASSLLTELGARVIKIEPLTGDLLRGYGPVGLKCVQGTQSITLDLKTTEGLAIVHRLVERSDALVHNYRPGVPERLGIDDATLRALNPRLIYLYAASYGSTGPMAARPAFHVTAGAICGGAQAQSGGDGTPGPDVELSDEEMAYWSERLTRCNEANPDFNAALVVAAAVTMALFARARTGAGQTLETRMMASNAYALSEHFIDYPGRPQRPMPDAGVHGLHALYRLYQTEDGWVFVAAPDDHAFDAPLRGTRHTRASGGSAVPHARRARRARRGPRPRARCGLSRASAPTTALASSPRLALPACGPTTLPTPRTSSTRRGPRSWASSRRSMPGWVRTVATAAWCAPSATSGPSAQPTSPARRRAASSPSSTTTRRRSRRWYPRASSARRADPEPARHSRRRQAGHGTVVVGGVATLRELQQDQHVLKRIGDDDDPADRDVERLDHDRAAGVAEPRRRSRDRLDQPVRFVGLLRGEHDLGLAVGQREPDLTDGVVPPAQFVPEHAAVEVEAGVEVGNRDRDRVDGLQQW